MSMKNKLGPKNSKESGSRKVGVVKSNGRIKVELYSAQYIVAGSYQTRKHVSSFFLYLDFCSVLSFLILQISHEIQVSNRFAFCS